MMTMVFRWLDEHPAFYWMAAAGATFLLAGWVLAGFRKTWAREIRPWREAVMALLLLLVIFAWRWPPLFEISPYNPDEAQVIAGALTLGQDPVFWRSVDGNTSGPLNFYALLPTHWLGIPQDYFNARLTGLLLVWGALWACYRMLRRDFGSAVAMLSVLPGLLFFATTIDTDFLQYSTEYLSFFLFASSASLLWQAHRESKPGAGYPLGAWLGAGLIMGLLPWAKLQAAPLAAALAGWGTLLAWRRTDHSWKERNRLVAQLAAAALLPGAGILGMVVVTGQWEHFLSSYIVNNLAYVKSQWGLWPVIGSFARICTYTWNFPGFLVMPLLTVLAAGVGLAVTRRRPSELFVVGGLMTVVALVCVLVPKRAFAHYLLFLILPLTWWGGAAFAELWQLGGKTWRRAAWGWSYALLALTVSLTIRLLDEPLPLIVGDLEKYWRHPRDEAGEILWALRQPGDTLVVWGWNCHLHVESGLGQGTREAVSERELRESDQRDTYYRPRYMEDLRRNRPTFFVDAVGPYAFGFSDRQTEGHENFPELADYIGEHYALVQELFAVRVYMRVDRLPPASVLLELEKKRL